MNEFLNLMLSHKFELDFKYSRFDSFHEKGFEDFPLHHIICQMFVKKKRKKLEVSFIDEESNKNISAESFNIILLVELTTFSC